MSLEVGALQAHHHHTPAHTCVCFHTLSWVKAHTPSSGRHTADVHNGSPSCETGCRWHPPIWTEPSRAHTHRCPRTLPRGGHTQGHPHSPPRVTFINSSPSPSPSEAPKALWAARYGVGAGRRPPGVYRTHTLPGGERTPRDRDTPSVERAARGQAETRGGGHAGDPPGAHHLPLRRGRPAAAAAAVAAAARGPRAREWWCPRAARVRPGGAAAPASWRPLFAARAARDLRSAPRPPAPPRSLARSLAAPRPQRPRPQEASPPQPPPPPPPPARAGRAGGRGRGDSRTRHRPRPQFPRAPWGGEALTSAPPNCGSAEHAVDRSAGEPAPPDSSTRGSSASRRVVSEDGSTAAWGPPGPPELLLCQSLSKRHRLQPLGTPSPGSRGLGQLHSGVGSTSTRLAPLKSPVFPIHRDSVAPRNY